MRGLGQRVAAFAAALASRAGFGGIAEAIDPDATHGRRAEPEHLGAVGYPHARARRNYALPDWAPRGGSIPGSWSSRSVLSQSTREDDRKLRAKRERRAERYRRELRTWVSP